jgi:NADH:ubiquinone oxidoreductase subunit 6 (subunit J)
MIALIVIALSTIATAAVAMSLRNLIHSALLLVASWAGIAAFYLWAGAEFIAFAQVLVYVGAVSMVVLFAVLLTRRSRQDLNLSRVSLWRLVGSLFPAAVVLGVLFGAIIGSPLPLETAGGATTSVKQLGTTLMNAHIAGVLIVGVILTVALIGAVVLAANDRDYTKGDK